MLHQKVTAKPGHAGDFAWQVTAASASQPVACRTGEADLASVTGLVITDLIFHPLYTTAAAVQILKDARDAQGGILRSKGSLVQDRLREIFKSPRFTSTLPMAVFSSGDRRYACRSVLLDSPDHDPHPEMVAIFLERQRRDRVDALEVSRRFHLSRRECETVQHLIGGLTTKEVAQRMGVSPNTIKQFIRMVMTKMSVTTRAGIISRTVTACFLEVPE